MTRGCFWTRLFLSRKRLIPTLERNLITSAQIATLNLLLTRNFW